MSLYTRYFRAALIAFIFGIALGNSLQKAQSLTMVAALAAFLIAYFYLVVLEPKARFADLSSRKKIVAFISLGLIFAMGRLSFSPPLPQLADKFEAVVVYDSVPTDYGSMVVVKSDNLARQTKVYTDRYPEFQTGDVVEISVKKNELEKKYIVGEVRLLMRGQRGGPVYYLNILKRKFSQSLRNIIPEPHASFATGTVVGGSASLPEELREEFRISGLTHILAASGYNFTLLLIFAAYIFRPLGLRKSLIISLLIIPGFAVIAGASPPVLRAATMGALANFAILSGRIGAIKSAVLWAAGIMLMLDPQLLNFDLGFQLSFLATAGLVFLVPAMERMFGIREGQSKSWQGLIFATIAAQIMTAPLIAYTFGTLSLVALPVNLIVVPAVPFIMVGSMTAATLYYLWPMLAAVAAAPVWLISDLIFRISRTASGFSYSLIHLNPSLFFTSLIYLLLATTIIIFHLKVLKHKHRI